MQEIIRLIELVVLVAACVGVFLAIGRRDETINQLSKRDTERSDELDKLTEITTNLALAQARSDITDQHHGRHLEDLEGRVRSLEAMRRREGQND